jgi:hypothetical protein
MFGIRLLFSLTRCGFGELLRKFGIGDSYIIEISLARKYIF